VVYAICSTEGKVVVWMLPLLSAAFNPMYPVLELTLAVGATIISPVVEIVMLSPLKRVEIDFDVGAAASVQSVKSV
jgi:hypothetical protein